MEKVLNEKLDTIRSMLVAHGSASLSLLFNIDTLIDETNIKFKNRNF